MRRAKTALKILAHSVAMSSIAMLMVGSVVVSRVARAFIEATERVRSLMMVAKSKAMNAPRHGVEADLLNIASAVRTIAGSHTIERGATFDLLFAIGLVTPGICPNTGATGGRLG